MTRLDRFIAAFIPAWCHLEAALRRVGAWLNPDKYVRPDFGDGEDE